MPAVDKAKLDEVIDTIRARQDGTVSLTDMVMLAEVTAETFSTFFSSMDQTIYRELREIASFITMMKQEIGALQAHDLKAQRIPAAGRELDLIVQATADATDTIMGCAEAIMAADASDPAAYKAFVDEKMITLFEACSFQDLTGQRVRKVVETLGQIEKRVTRFATVINAEDVGGFADAAEQRRAERADALLLNGPQAAGQAIEQAEIDAMMGDAQSDIDALFAA